MDSQAIRYTIELEKYIFELKYQKDFKGAILWLSGIVILLIEGVLSGRFPSQPKTLIVVSISGMMVILLGLTSVYLYKRNIFLQKINRLRHEYDHTH